MPKTGKKIGRPPTPSDKVEETKKRILELFSDDDPKHKSLRSIAPLVGFDRSTISDWESKDREFSRQSALARRAAGDFFKDKKVETVEELRLLVHAAISGKVKIPNGVVEGYKVIIQEYEREAQIRNPDNYAERKKVDLSGGLDLNVPEGLGAVYERFGIKPKE